VREGRSDGQQEPHAFLWIARATLADHVAQRRAVGYLTRRELHAADSHHLQQLEQVGAVKPHHRLQRVSLPVIDAKQLNAGVGPQIGGSESGLSRVDFIDAVSRNQDHARL